MSEARYFTKRGIVCLLLGPIKPNNEDIWWGPQAVTSSDKSVRNSDQSRWGVAQRLKALTILAEDPCSIPSSHIMAHNPLWLQFQGIQNPFLASTRVRHSYGAHVYMQKDKTSIHISRTIHIGSQRLRSGQNYVNPSWVWYSQLPPTRLHPWKTFFIPTIMQEGQDL